ncbi:extracellular solute-binding protein [Micromonospora sp. WMMD737]|uniref:extracellular solute-binding protein n=1 Tax=Micromonospora sp. WMMD737 TaxID=3404113 RepID=UPI003B93D756
MRRRQWSALCAGVVLSLALSACGNGAAPSAGRDASTLRVWFPGNLSSEIALVNDELVPAFEAKHPGVDVQVEFVDWGNLSTRLSTAFAGNTAPDVFGHGNAAAAGFAKAGRVAPLDERVAGLPGGAADLTFLADGKVDGKQYVMPLRGFGYLVAYRTDLMTAAGLDPAKPPATWDDLRSAAQKLTVRDGGKITRSGLLLATDNPTSMTQSFASFLYQAGGAFLGPDGASVTWNSPEAVSALSFATGLYQGGDAVATGVGEKTANAGAQHPLVTGRAAMALVDDATLKTIYEQAPEMAKNIAVAPATTGPKAAASFGGAGNGMFVSAGSKQQDRAWEFIAFLLEAENLKKYTMAVGGIPARGSLAKDPELAALPYLAPYMTSAAAFRGNPVHPKWTQLRDSLGASVEKAFRTPLAPQAALDEAAVAAEKVLKG